MTASVRASIPASLSARPSLLRQDRPALYLVGLAVIQHEVQIWAKKQTGWYQPCSNLRHVRPGVHGRNPFAC